MTINFSPYKPPAGLDLGNCIFCHEDLLDGRRLMAHEGDGQKHPLHTDCFLKSIVYWKRQCPSGCVGEIKSPLLFQVVKTKNTVQSIFFCMKRVAKGFVEGTVIGFFLTQPFVRFDFISVNHAILVTSLITTVKIAARVLE